MAAPKPTVEICLEETQVRQADGGPALWCVGRVPVARWIGVVCPGIEAKPRRRGCDKTSKDGRRLAVVKAADVAIETAGCGLAGGHERVRARALDSGIRGSHQPGVDAWRDRPPGRVELRLQEHGGVRLVPDREEAYEREARIAARIARCEGVRELLQLTRVGRRDARPGAAVGPAGGSPDCEQHFDSALVGIAYELVEIVQPVLRGERIRGPSRPDRSDLRPVDERTDHRRPLALREVKVRVPVRLPAKGGVVEEADVQPG